MKALALAALLLLGCAHESASIVAQPEPNPSPSVSPVPPQARVNQDLEWWCDRERSKAQDAVQGKCAEIKRHKPEEYKRFPWYRRVDCFKRNKDAEARVYQDCTKPKLDREYALCLQQKGSPWDW